MARRRSGAGQTLVLGITDPVSTVLITGLPQMLREAGWQVDLVVGGPTTVPGATVHELAMRRDPAPAADLRALLGWVRLLARLRPEVVLSGTPKAGLLGMVAAAFCRVPVRIYHLRGLRLETSTGPIGRLLALLERIAMGCATEILAVSGSLVDECVGRGLAPRSKFRVLGRGSSNGVDLGRFAPAASASAVAEAREALRLDAGRTVIGYVGRLTDSKGLDVLVDAVCRLPDRLAVQVLLVGGEEQPGYGARLAARLAQAGVPFTLTGSIGISAATYHAMDVFCLPSLREGFPNVVLEAAACGTTVVTTTATGCRDAVVADTTGWLAAVGDAGELTAALAEACDDPLERRRRADAGRAWVASAFERGSVQRQLADYLRTRTSRMTTDQEWPWH